MAKLTDFKTPTGVSGNLFNISSIWQLVLGSFVMLLTFALGQNLLGVFGSKTPFLDTRIEKPYYDPSPTNTAPAVEVI